MKKRNLIFILLIGMVLLTLYVKFQINKTTNTDETKSQESLNINPQEITPAVDNDFYINEKVPNQVRDIILADRAYLYNEIEPNMDLFKSYLVSDYDEDKDDEIINIYQSIPFSYRKSQISREDAIEEVIYIMDYLKYFYGGYGYFGGDEVFNELKKDIISQLNSLDDSINIFSYKDLLSKNFSSVIFDGHFALDHQNIFSGYTHFLLNETFQFFKNEQTVITTDGKYELISMDSNSNDSNLELLPYIDLKGNFVWVVGIKSLSVDSINVSLTLNDLTLDETQTYMITLDEANRFNVDEHTFYNVYEKDGIKIAESSHLELFPDENHEEKIKLMETEGKQLQDEEILILDLRGNYGGYSTYASAWIQGFIGLNELPSPNGELRTRRLTKTVAYFSPFTDFDSVEEFEENLRMESDHTEVIGWDKISYFKPTCYNNKNTLIFVLIDSNTGSSGEFFADLMKKAENTIIVGSNTLGSISFGNILDFELPYSKVELSCGVNLSLKPDCTSIEGIGVEPDIWAPPSEALDRVLLFIQTYNLR